MTSMQPMPSRRLRHEEVLHTVKALAPSIREHTASVEVLHWLPKETIQSLKQAGITRGLMPTRFGGNEGSFKTLVDAAVELAHADVSVGWWYAFQSVHAWVLSFFPVQAQEAIWGRDPDTSIAASFTPTGQAQPVHEGYLVQGRWEWVNGIQESGWVILAARVSAQQQASGEERLFVLPTHRIRVLDSSDGLSLRTSVSHTVEVPETQVRAAYSVRVQEGQDGQIPGARFHANTSLSTIPLRVVLPLALLASLLGAAHAAYDLVYEKDCRSLGAGPDLQPSQIPFPLAECTSEIEAAHTFLHKALASLDGSSTLSPVQQTYVLQWYASCARLCLHVVSRLSTMSASRGDEQEPALQRVFRDVHTMASYTRLHFLRTTEAFVLAEMGMPIQAESGW